MFDKTITDAKPGDTVTGGQDTTAGAQDTTEGGDKKDDPAKAAIDPAAFKIPENTPATPENLATFAEWAKTAGLNQDQAQAGLDLHLAIMKQQQTDFVNQVGEWRKECEKDATYGGQKINDSVKNANDLVRRFGDDELIEDISAFGFGSRLPFLRFLNKVHAATKDDSVAGTGTTGGIPEKNVASVLWPNMPKAA